VTAGDVADEIGVPAVQLDGGDNGVAFDLHVVDLAKDVVDPVAVVGVDKWHACGEAEIEAGQKQHLVRKDAAVGQSGVIDITADRSLG
jgi:hypothetical protein